MNQFPKLGVIPNIRGQGGCYCGRRGLPREWVLQMYEDYKRLGSLEKVADLHDRTRQNMWGIFKTHGLKLNAKTFLKPRFYKGVKYTHQSIGGRTRYYRATIGRGKGRQKYLHHVIWEEQNGPIPEGNKICFKDGDSSNCAISNMVMMTHEEQQQQRGTGNNQFTVTAADRLQRLMSGGVVSSALKARAA